MKIIVTGATGLVGAEVIRQAILDAEIEEITAIARKPLFIQHPKLKTIIHKNYMDYTGLEEVFKKNDACLWCLGISQTQVSKEEYIKITYDYTIAAAEAMTKAKPEMIFMFLSGEGADLTETSKTIFARIKGKAENQLMRMPISKLYIARPAGIRPVNKNPNTAFTNKLMIPFFPFLEMIVPQFVIKSTVLAKAMLHIVKHGSANQMSDNVELKRIGMGV
ncbi:MAG: NAD-dependent epimerase/dehydratase family protein [Bacteroidetes bacterium]|nr:NAD-dependent epimerase/dehydratase family protein [Bacteroidota bacterium]